MRARTVRVVELAVVAAVSVMAADRPSSWATPLTVRGVPNLHRLSADVYRSGQPTAEGFRELERLGIRTVLCLRALHTDGKLLSGTSLRLIELPLVAFAISDREARKALSVVSDAANYPLLVHCLHGSDRTGLVCALYRMGVQGWSAEEAVRELTEGGYGFHAVFGNIPAQLRRLRLKPKRARKKP